jgi:hypothetical protein
MSKPLIAIAIGMFALGIFAGHAISTAPNANATVKASMSKVDQVVPFDLMAKSKELPIEASAAF